MGRSGEDGQVVDDDELGRQLQQCQVGGGRGGHVARFKHRRHAHNAHVEEVLCCAVHGL